MVTGKKSPYVPDRGDIVFLKFTPQAGRKQKGPRPALVLSPASYNGKVGLAVVCPITSNSKGYPFEVTLGNKVPAAGVVLTDQIKSLDWMEWQATFTCKAPQHVLDEAIGKIIALLTK